ncbi:MAG TPA: nucleotidyltransferase family protein [archaeon]|nr:nucleotidyltransferase family protein [archaeon]
MEKKQKGPDKRMEALLPKIREILKRNGAKKAGLFGSFARGENRKGSDIDLLVDLGEGKSLLDLIGLEQELEQKTKSKFDLVTYKSLNHLIRDDVLSEEVKVL